MSVRPRAMASGTRTVMAGLQRLDSLYGHDTLLSEAYVYVPKRSVGTRRVPLVVLLHGSSMDGLVMINWHYGMFTTFADTNGYILLAPTTHSDGGGWDDARNIANVDVPRISAAIRQVLSHYAIDPTRIALLGVSAGAGAALDFGYVNGDVFSRVIAFSGFVPFYGDHEFDPFHRHGMPAFYIGISTHEATSMKMPVLVSWLRNAGYQVTYLEDSGSHSLLPERANPAFNWLINSWK